MLDYYRLLRPTAPATGGPTTRTPRTRAPSTSGATAAAERDTALIVVEAYPPGDLFAVVVQVQAVTEADLEALDTILQTFYVNP